jgi:hypothetical protein
MSHKVTSKLNINGVLVDPSKVEQPADRKFRDYWQYDGEVISVDWTKARENFRNKALMSKAAFCLVLVEAGVLTSEQAVDAAKGNWPTAFDDVFEGVDATKALEARLAWASVTEVHRNADILEDLLEHPNVPLTAEQLDTAFGYEGQ